MNNFEFIIPKLKNIIIEANNKIMEIYQKDFQVDFKSDKSPLTLADIESNNIICSGLKDITIDNQKPLIISEENNLIDFNNRKNNTYCWLIDPLDGTKEFVKKNGEFTTNIGLIKNGKVIFGMVGIPCHNVIYWGGINIPAVKFNYETNDTKPLTPRKSINPYIIVTSRSHLNEDTQNCIEYLKNKFNNIRTISTGSSIKMLMVADGIANFYPRYGPTMEWDTCGAHGVLKGVNLNLVDLNNNELSYNKPSLYNPYFKTL